MRLKTLLIVFLVGFAGLCAGLIVESGLFSKADSLHAMMPLAQEITVKGKSADPCVQAVPAPVKSSRKSLTADNTEQRTLVIGSTDPCSGYKFQIELTNTGASVLKATLSGFETRGTKLKKPLVVMQPVNTESGRILPMANGNFVFVNDGLQVPLGKLNWQSSDIITGPNGSQQVTFEAIIKDDMDRPAVKVVKKYGITRGSYDVNCTVDIENLSKDAITTRFEMFGPAGIGSEDIRGDIGIVSAYLGTDQLIETAKFDQGAIIKAGGTKALEAPKKEEKLLWAALINKYFALIVRPAPLSPAAALSAPEYITNIQAESSPENSAKKSTGVRMQIAPTTLAAAGTAASSQSYKFQVFVGPKERSLFDKNPLYQQLGYIHTIQFGACCSMGFIDTLAFAILALMKWAYQYIPNYGVVIIILVLLVRLVLHPITKSSQISMMKMGKLGPKAEEIRKKYADNKQEMNRRIMELYKEQGASPVLGCLPMLLQMPIWIALYSAIYAGMELRGAKFLPFWITDLSGSDAIISFTPVTIPLIGVVIASFNLLPILLAIAMFLQQKLTPTSAQGAVSEQMQQQQKMMLFMMPVMMLLFLYNAPSGLNLYIMASTFGGIIEQYFIRKHVREKEAEEAETLVSGTAKMAKVKKKKPKPFFRF